MLLSVVVMAALLVITVAMVDMSALVVGFLLFLMHL